jgi:pimeloyl-ACP methyl ester carboxylesterase
VVDALFNEANLVSVETAQTLTLPILIFSGTDDLLWPPAVLKELCELLPSAERCGIDSGHSPYFENPVVFNQVLAEFLLREVPPG